MTVDSDVSRAFFGDLQCFRGICAGTYAILNTD